MELVQKDIKPRDIMTVEAFENAIKVLMATGASTNLVIHLIAIARRAGINLILDDFDRISKTTPFIADVKPCGSVTVEELYHAGGTHAVMKTLEPLLHTQVMTASGQTLAENLKSARVRNPNVIRPLDNPIDPEGGLRIVRGSLAPDGAVIKTSAGSPHLLKHTGPAAVLTSQRQDDIDRDFAHLTADHVIINRNMGPVGAPGMPEVGPTGLPRHLLRQGIRDMVRITDARMSGTSFGTIVLHVAPEAAIGGPLAIIQNGDMIELDAGQGVLNVLLDQREIQRRLSEWRPPVPKYEQGFRALWIDQVLQAPDGCDFEFCVTEDWLSRRDRQRGEAAQQRLNARVPDASSAGRRG
jgi:dihydroxy-acid dehydratase